MTEPASPAASRPLPASPSIPGIPGTGRRSATRPTAGPWQESSAELDLDLELPADRWHPVDPDPAPARPGPCCSSTASAASTPGSGCTGARRTAQPAPGIAASLAAGLVACDGAARIADVTVERGIFTAAPDAADIVTRHGRYPARRADGPGPDKLSLALQQRLGAAEVQLAMAFRAGHQDDDDLLIVDGPLRGRTHLDRTVGYIKTHHASYLPPRQAAVVGALDTGQRTPVFTMGTSWRRHSWYLRLPGAPGVPWSGVVRLECSPDLPAAAAARLADLTARLLPPLASAPHKDPRAPQNLVPIGGLERELRRRLGDQQLLYRALRSASSVTQSAPSAII